MNFMSAELFFLSEPPLHTEARDHTPTEAAYLGNCVVPRLMPNVNL